MADIRFTGNFDRRVDDAGRLAIPASYRNKLGTSVILSPGLDGQIELYPDDAFAKMVDRRADPDDQTKEGRQRLRAMTALAITVEVGDQGRITIPDDLRNAREIDGITYFVGMGEYIEIWAQERWEKELGALNDNYADLLEGLSKIADVDEEASS